MTLEILQKGKKKKGEVNNEEDIAVAV